MSKFIEVTESISNVVYLINTNHISRIYRSRDVNGEQYRALIIFDVEEVPYLITKETYNEVKEMINE